MQFLSISATTKLSDIADVVGDRNVESILATNNIVRTPNIGQAMIAKRNNIIANSDIVPWQRKTTVLNTFIEDSDIFEKAALLGDNDWKVLSMISLLPMTLRIPDFLKLPSSTQIIGDGVHIAKNIYDEVMLELKSASHTIDPAIFNEYSNIKSSKLVNFDTDSGFGVFQYFQIPWGEITIHSSLSDTSMDIPVYPEEVSDSRKANYTTMPDLLYQYEPWQIYESSGPRTNTYKFASMHRDMWSGNHADGKANELIRFCEANLYPKYNGSAVYTAITTLYVSGKTLISGILTDVTVDWEGPILDDGWYATFTLSLTITEVAKQPLNYNSVRNLPIIGEGG